jgi:hypothetical protein
MYRYASEDPKLPLPEKTDKKEEPISYDTKEFVGKSDNAVVYMLYWWQTRNRSGITKNPSLKAKG